MPFKVPLEAFLASDLGAAPRSCSRQNLSGRTSVLFSSKPESRTSVLFSSKAEWLHLGGHVLVKT
jgi:hypothetical protein